MIRKGNKVKWKENNTVRSGIVEETYAYKQQKTIRKRSKTSCFSRAVKALYIRLKNGKHVLKNDNEVFLETSNNKSE
ncbi:hypothetical protein [Aquimarina spongiae]|uniref:Hypervirulence associated protein TUDOR domain-containing protein n=1 Tax=Aquimarina spongiae TaxID=570521 RepID=A0A1M6GME5_9FLAO|nr:hypothetical protein [Aquimarina spongiae]SHJ11095.1 hypothetical protein SAMN04488508_105351 [Aquimarina spongiae]